MKPGLGACIRLRFVPVIVVGADTVVGRAIIEGLIEPEREVRAFVTAGDVATELRGRGVKVALGDVSDDSHVEMAATNCFTAVLITEAAEDGRERAFASSPSQVIDGWATAVTASGVRRVIGVSDGDVAATGARETARVPPSQRDLVAEVAALDSARSLR